MRKARILIVGFLLGSLFLGGCSRNSSLQVVVPKKEQDSALLSQETGDSVQEQVQAPTRYLCDKDFDHFRLLANARVIVPDVEGIPLKKIRSRTFTKDDLKKLQDTVLKDCTIYELKEPDGYENELAITENTSPDEAEKLTEEERETTYEELYSGQTQVVEEKLPEGIEDCFALFQDLMDGKKTFCFDTEEDFKVLEKLCLEAGEKEKDWKKQQKYDHISMICDELVSAIEGGTTWEKREIQDLFEEKEFFGIVLRKDEFLACSLQNSIPLADGSEVQFSLWPPYGDVFSEIQAESVAPENGDTEIQYHEENLSGLDLQKRGKELMKGLGLEETELWEVRDDKVFWWIRDVGTYAYEGSNEEPVQTLSYVRNVDGVPVIQTSTQTYSYIQEDSLMNWPQEKISVTYGKDGMVSFHWNAPVEIEDWQDEAFLLPFSEISQIFEEMLEGSLTTFNTDAGVLTGDLNVSEVRLGYVRVINRELLQEDSNVSTENGQEVYEGVLVPAWSFIGTAAGTVAEAYGVEEGTRIIYMTINATDGSIIEN